MIKPYYRDRYVTIYHGDCREILPTLDKMDLVLTDPPYIGLGDNIAHWGDSGVGKHYGDSITVGNPWDASLDWLQIAWDRCTRGMLVFCSYHNVDRIPSLVDGKKVALISWHSRNSPTPVHNVPHFTTQFIWAFQRETGLLWRKLKTMYDIPKLATGCISSGERFMDVNKRATHPTQKPEALMMELLKVEADTILDPFLGTGTTAYCAKKLNRKCIGIEIEEKYCEIAANRCRQTVMELGI